MRTNNLRAALPQSGRSSSKSENHQSEENNLPIQIHICWVLRPCLMHLSNKVAFAPENCIHI